MSARLLVNRCVRPKLAEDEATSPRPSARRPPPTPVPKAEESMLVQFYNAKLITPGGVVEGDLWVYQGRIADPKHFFWERRSHSADRRIDCHGMLLAPGCIDIMLHEAFGVRVLAGKAIGAAGLHPRRGIVCSFQR